MFSYDIVWPFYKDHKYFHRCLNFINSQSIKPKNLIFLNDGDKNPYLFNILEKKLNSKINLIYYRNSRNLGATKTLELGFMKIRSNYFHQIATDDVIHRKFIETNLIQLATRKNVAFTFSKIIYNVEKSKKATHIPLHFLKNKNWITSNEMEKFYSSYQFKIYNNTVCFRKKFFLKKNLIKDIYGIGCDMLNLQYLSFKYGCIYINKELASFTIREGQIGKITTSPNEYFKLYEKLKKNENHFLKKFIDCNLHFDLPVTLQTFHLLIKKKHLGIFSIRWFLRSIKFSIWKKVRYKVSPRIINKLSKYFI